MKETKKCFGTKEYNQSGICVKCSLFVDCEKVRHKKPCFKSRKNKK